MDATEKSVCITQPSCEGLKISRGQIVKEQKTLIIKTCQIRNNLCLDLPLPQTEFNGCKDWPNYPLIF